MPNPIKYTAGTETLALKKGNFYIGTRDVAKGPTSATGYYAGITPPTNGYTIYLNKASSGPSIYVATGATDLITITNRIAGTNYTTSGECLNYFATQTDKMVFNRDYESIITSGLTLNVDAGFTPSYPTTGTTWYDISLSGNNGTLVNGPTFSGGSIVFDGVDDYVDCGSNNSLNLFNTITIESWVKWGGNNAINFIPIVEKQYNNQDTYFFGFNGSSRLHFGSSGGNIQSTNTTWTIGKWYLVTATYSSNPSITGALYINGAPEPLSVDSLDTMSSTSSPVYIGYRFSQNIYFNGSISGLKIYNRALSSSEVLQNYQSTFTRFLGENIVGNSLALYLDAGYSPSYSGAGTTWYDISGNNNNGTLTNGPTFSANTIVFDGSDDYVSLGNVVNVTTEPFTLNAWFKQTYDGNYQAIITKGTGSGTGVGYRMLTTPSNPPQVYIDVSDNVTSNTFLSNNTIKPGVWNNVLMVRESSNTFRIYINGILDKTVIKNVGNIGSSYPLQVGKQSDASYIFKGQMSVASIYTKPLTPFDVYQNYNAQKSRFGIPDIITNGLVLNLDAGNPYSYNPLNTGSTRWADVTNSTTGGTLVNGTYYSGGTMVFDGTDDYVFIKDGFTKFFKGKSYWTASIWVKVSGWGSNNDAFPVLVSIGENQGQYGELYLEIGNSNQFYMSYAGDFTANSFTTNLNQIYNLVYMKDGNDFKFYSNGVLINTSGGKNAVSTADGDLWLGRFKTGDFELNGNIYGFSMYNRALNDSEVLQNYNALKERYGL